MPRTYSCTGKGAPPIGDSGNFPDGDGWHCCYVMGQRCPFLVENQGGRRYACGLMLEYGSWEAVNASMAYRPIGQFWQATGHGFNYCETFDPAFCCRPEHRHDRDNESSPLPEGVTCCGNMG